MSENIVVASIPMDGRFLRRSCPSCEREFKRSGDVVDDADSAADADAERESP